jgi:hypothetical protein
LRQARKESLFGSGRLSDSNFKESAGIFIYRIEGIAEAAWTSAVDRLPGGHLLIDEKGPAARSAFSGTIISCLGESSGKADSPNLYA